MGRKSKLSEKQWDDMKRRNLDGETLRSLAREYGVSESTAREKISAQTAQIKTVANQIVETAMAIKELPLSAQVSAHNLADKMLAISMALGDAAVAGALTAKRINEAAQNHTAKKSDAELMGEEGVKAMMAASMVANAAGKIGMDLLNLAAKPGAMKQDGNGQGSKLVSLTAEDIRLINEELDREC